MSCVAEQKAVIVNKIRAVLKCPCGANHASNATVTAISSCITNTHHRLVRITSTNGLQSGLTTQGNAISEVNKAISLLGTPSCANSVTLILVTKKYGIPSAKYSVGTHTHGDIWLLAFNFHLIYLRACARMCYWKLARLSVTSALSSMSCIAWYGRYA